MAEKQYDFTHVPKRQGNFIKWGVLKEKELPMWIAEMDFKIAPEIMASMEEKLKVAAFGYESVPAEYYKAVADWEEIEHRARPKEDWCVFASGVVPAISAMVRQFTSPGDQILVQEPVYNMFYSVIEGNGRRVISSDLIYENSKYSVNWADLEEKLATPSVRMTVFCNPHNPIGYAWSEEEVKRIAELCAKHQVFLISDEIHGDLVLTDEDITPAFTVDWDAKNWVVSLISPSKTFNLAALHAACAIIPNQDLRARAEESFFLAGIGEPNLLAIPAAIATYEEGHDWLRELKQVLRDNFAYARDFLAKEVPEVKVLDSNASYLAWVDISALGMNAEDFCKYLREKTGLIIYAGNGYRGNGHEFVRINLACPKELVIDGMQRLKQGVLNLNN
ncbi:plastocyanin [Lactobacillus delbrueckii subsp. bulgaricus]|nr:plastocyanin [Lactobacillus delbrueckii subsp. bulgaricus]MBT8812752.1 plastocyanin [Lactobacillus delbrueckii subsp. bulgaricus]MBT8819344.1 plastocyanin [Lactobacillus delbrueckii subsp. bulgaricus]MBT8820691.1 plastocyanin [Lactobacillus delbrueckii subsp. bulgaricus]MBT8822535.1 plastocyanin [Lactobacillus delbrueckii subsp. bulgaricus]